jgi:hypothetical protein
VVYVHGGEPRDVFGIVPYTRLTRAYAAFAFETV